MKPGPEPRDRLPHGRLARRTRYRQVETPTGEKERAACSTRARIRPSGVIVHYWLREAPAGDVTLAFLDGDGREIRSFTSRTEPARAGPAVRRRPAAAAKSRHPAPEPPAPRRTTSRTRPRTPGANRFVWNLRGPDATKLPDNKGRGGSVDMLAGPRVPPGHYQVRLTVNGRTLTQRFEVVEGSARCAPRTQISAQQYALGEAGARPPHARARRGAPAPRRARPGGGWAGRVGRPAIKGAAAALARTLTAIEEELIQVRSDDPRMFPSKLNTRIGTVVPLIEYSDAAPTQALRDLADDLARRADAELAKLDRLLAEDVAPFNALCRDAGVGAIIPRPRGGG